MSIREKTTALRLLGCLLFITKSFSWCMQCNWSPFGRHASSWYFPGLASPRCISLCNLWSCFKFLGLLLTLPMIHRTFKTLTFHRGSPPTCFFPLLEPLLPSAISFTSLLLSHFNSPVLYSLAISPLHTSPLYPIIPRVIAHTFVQQKLTE